MKSIRAKVALQFVVNNWTIVTNFALSLLLARLLSPADIGIFSMSAVLISVAHVFRDFGVAAYIKQVKTLTDETIRVAMGVLIASSWSVSAVLFFGASLWADFLHEPRIVEVVHVLALGFVFVPFGAIPSAILTRRLEVGKTSLVALISNLSHFIVCLSLAMLGFGHMTMAWANLIDILVCGVGYRLVLAERLPIWPHFKGWRQVTRFGAGNVLPSLLQRIDAAIPDLALGRQSTAADVGLFSRANSTVNLLGEAINPTIHYFALPYLAQVHHEKGRIDQEFLYATSVLNAVVVPTLAIIAVLAPELVTFLFGVKWLPSAQAVPWLCVAFGLSSLFALTAPAVTSIGKPYAATGPLMVLAVAKILFAFSFFDGTLERFAMSVAAAQIISLPFFLVVNKVYLGVGVVQWFRNTLPVLALAAVSYFACWGVRQLMPVESGSFVILVSCGVATVLISMLVYFPLKLPIVMEIMRVPALRRLLARNHRS